jgi:hypothetical protein
LSSYTSLSKYPSWAKPGHPFPSVLSPLNSTRCQLLVGLCLSLQKPCSPPSPSLVLSPFCNILKHPAAPPSSLLSRWTPSALPSFFL